MKLVNQLLEYPKHIEKKQVFMFTGNRAIRNGQLVMGAGNALACKKAYPSIAKKMVTQIHKTKNVNEIHNVFVKMKDGMVGCMFTKDLPQNPSNLEDVIDAIGALKAIASKHYYLTFHLPYPAIGLGGLTRDELDEHVNTLPDNVVVYVS